MSLDPDDLGPCLTVTVATGVVHRWDCNRRPTILHEEAWRPSMSGLDDRACPSCLPEGLPD